LKRLAVNKFSKQGIGIEMNSCAGIEEDFGPGQDCRSVDRDAERIGWGNSREMLERPRWNARSNEIARGIGTWLLGRWRRSAACPAQMALIERIPLGPKQSLSLVEADGVRVLVATSADGSAVFFALSNSPSAAPALAGAVQSNTPQTKSFHQAGREKSAPLQSDRQALRRGAREVAIPHRLGFQGRISW
jgi:hypothetical protein